ncbi:hypothetical protein ACFZCL_09330 [Streptomyces sp. NPDC008159]|uniref:hypothetical protein n=1 Tax=Streptomyces sp. NPDC008159 TaxID=3364817 RepID=UPI0036E23BAD
MDVVNVEHECVIDGARGIVVHHDAGPFEGLRRHYAPEPDGSRLGGHIVPSIPTAVLWSPTTLTPLRSRGP